MLVYLDLCCLKRPFDDKVQARIRIEAEAVLALLDADPERVSFVRSPAHDLENQQNPLAWRAERVGLWLSDRLSAPLDEHALGVRTTALVGLGFRGFDALHLACAEAMGAELFVSCDDRLLSTARRQGELVRVRVLDVISAAREVLA